MFSNNSFVACLINPGAPSISPAARLLIVAATSVCERPSGSGPTSGADTMDHRPLSAGPPPPPAGSKDWSVSAGGRSSYLGEGRMRGGGGAKRDPI